MPMVTITHAKGTLLHANGTITHDNWITILTYLRDRSYSASTLHMLTGQLYMLTVQCYMLIGQRNCRISCHSYIHIH